MKTSERFSELAQATLHGSANKQIEVTIPFRSVSPIVRTSKALLMLSACWTLAVATFFVPVLHFFLVPLFFFGGIFTAYRIFTFKAVLGMATLQCPDCLGLEQFPAQRFREAIYFVCHSCGQHLCLEHRLSTTEHV